MHQFSWSEASQWLTVYSLTVWSSLPAGEYQSTPLLPTSDTQIEPYNKNNKLEMFCFYWPTNFISSSTFNVGKKNYFRPISKSLAKQIVEPSNIHFPFNAHTSLILNFFLKTDLHNVYPIIAGRLLTKGKYCLTL